MIVRYDWNFSNFIIEVLMAYKFYFFGGGERVLLRAVVWYSHTAALPAKYHSNLYWAHDWLLWNDIILICSRGMMWQYIMYRLHSSHYRLAGYIWHIGRFYPFKDFIRENLIWTWNHWLNFSSWSVYEFILLYLILCNNVVWDSWVTVRS